MPTPDDLTPQERFERYVQLLRQIKSLEKQADDLKRLIKTDLQGGLVLQNETQFARLKTSQTTSYDSTEFSAVFGDALLLQVSSIDNKKVLELLNSGEIDELRLLPLQHIKQRTPALVIEARDTTKSEHHELNRLSSNLVLGTRP